MHNDDSSNPSYVRWQEIRITQLGVCISLFLTFAVATLGFSANYIVSHADTLPMGCWGHVFFVLSCLSGLISILVGGSASLTRLVDFRETAQIVRENPGASLHPELLAEKRARAKRLGWWTWLLFVAQTCAMGIQFLLLFLSLAFTYWKRIF